MRKVIVAVVACLLSAAAVAQTAPQTVSLRGQWNVTVPSEPNYRATILIDAQHRATLDASTVIDGQSRRFKALGYATIAFPKVEILLTNRKEVSRTVCSMQSRDKMNCHEIFPDGRISTPSVMTRDGPGPESLMPASR